MRVKVVTVMRWYVQDEVNQEDSEQNEVDGMKGADSTGKVMHMWKSGWWLVMRKIRMGGWLTVTVWEHNVWTLSAELHCRAFHVGLRRHQAHLLTDLRRPGERHFVHVHVLRNGCTGRRTVPGDHVHHTRREPGLTSDISVTRQLDWSLVVGFIRQILTINVYRNKNEYCR